MSFKIVDTDRGYKELMAKLTDKNQPSLKVGVLQADGSKPAQGGKGVSIYEVATFNEFGLGVPERPFIRGWVDENQEKVLQVLKEQMVIALKRGEPFENVLERLGLYCVGGIQQRISDKGNGAYEPNADSTIARKGSDVPLIDYGQLRSSITHEVIHE